MLTILFVSSSTAWSNEERSIAESVLYANTVTINIKTNFTHQNSNANGQCTITEVVGDGRKLSTELTSINRKATENVEGIIQQVMVKFIIILEI